MTPAVQAAVSIGGIHQWANVGVKTDAKTVMMLFLGCRLNRDRHFTPIIFSAWTYIYQFEIAAFGKIVMGFDQLFDGIKFSGFYSNESVYKVRVQNILVYDNLTKHHALSGRKHQLEVAA